MEKVSVYKFVHISLLKKWCPIKTKKVINNQKKKNQSPKFIKKIKIKSRKKNKNKNKKHKRKQKRKRKKRIWALDEACPVNY